jgi:outer membrane protein assembly factor BamB
MAGIDPKILYITGTGYQETEKNMKKLTFHLLILGLALFFSCHKKSPTETPGNNIHPQVDIPWPSLANSPWPITHDDMQCTGRSKFIGPREGKVVWAFTEEEFIFEESGIVIGEDGSVYFTARLRKPERHHFLYALNPDGALKWRRKLNDTDSYSPTPIIGNGDIIYIIRQDGRYYAFDHDGNLKWKLDTPTSNYIISAGLGLNEVFYYADTRGALYALNNDGTLKWSNYKISESYIPYTYSIAMSPDGSTVYAAAPDSTINAIDAATGCILWQLKIGYNLLYSSPMVDSDGNVYFIFEEEGKGFLIYSLTPDGEIRWKSEKGVGYMASMCMDKDGNIYAYSGYLHLISFDYNGKFRWQSPLISGDIWQWPTSIIVDAEGVAYIVMPWRYVMAFDQQGNQLFICELPDPSDWLIMGAISKDGYLYLASKYQVYCIK